MPFFPIDDAIFGAEENHANRWQPDAAFIRHRRLSVPEACGACWLAVRSGSPARCGGPRRVLSSASGHRTSRLRLA